MTRTDVSQANQGSHHVPLPVGKFNQGVSAETKKQTWAEITDQINSLGENHREVCYYHLLFSHVSDNSFMNLQTVCDLFFFDHVNLRYFLRLVIFTVIWNQSVIVCA